MENNPTKTHIISTVFFIFFFMLYLKDFTMSNVTININNCGCGCGHSEGTGSETVPYNEPGDPTSASGPPEGYSEPPGTLADRQCKSAVWLYDWLQASVDMLANTTEGYGILITIKTALLAGAIGSIGTYLAPLVGGAIVSVIDFFAVPGPTELISGPIAAAVIALIIVNVADVATENISQPYLQDALPKIQAAQDAIICSLSKATSGVDAELRMTNALIAAGLAPQQRSLVIGWVPVALYNLLFYTADWWPSFDDDYLSGITTTCCGDYVDGEAINPGSVQQCQASYFIVDMLAETFQAVEDASKQFQWDFYSDKEEMYNYLKTNLTIPRLVQENGYYDGFVRWSAEALYQNSILGQIVTLFSYGDFADYITANRDTLTTGLQAETTIEDAYDYLIADFQPWLEDTNNVSDGTIGLHMVAALNALIEPAQAATLLDLLFTQNSELLGYNLGGCSSDCQIATTLLGTVSNWDVNSLTLNAQAAYGHVGSNPDDWWLHIDIPAICGDMQITSISLNNYTLPTVPGLGSCAYVDQNDVTQLGNQTDPSVFMLNAIVGDGQYFNIISDTQFTVEIVFQVVP